MPALTLAPARPALFSEPSPAFPRRRLAAALLVAGLAVCGGATAGLATLGTPDGTAPVAPEPPAPQTQALTIAGPEAVSVVTQVYGPGQDSGWHAHSGIHAVAILSGTLTVYDAKCGSHTFTPGTPYVGGQELHLARNQTTEPVEMVVTYLTPAVAGNSTRHAGPPPCWAGNG